MSEVIEEMRVLLEQFRHSDWRDLYVRTARCELFMAKAGGAGNPMHAGPPDAKIATIEAVEPSAAPLSNMQPIVAPHVGTLAWLASADVAVAPGSVVASLEVLGERIDLTTDVGGRVGSTSSVVGALVEFGETILSIVS